MCIVYFDHLPNTRTHVYISHKHTFYYTYEKRNRHVSRSIYTHSMTPHPPISIIGLSSDMLGSNISSFKRDAAVGSPRTSRAPRLSRHSRQQPISFSSSSDKQHNHLLLPHTYQYRSGEYKEKRKEKIVDHIGTCLLHINSTL
jgi:hypothetical protein